MIDSAEIWMILRVLRNQMVHEYMVDAEKFALTLNQAHVSVTLLVATYNAINDYARKRISVAEWPGLLPVREVEKGS